SGSRLSGPRKYTAGCFQPKHSINYFSRAGPNAPSGSIRQGLAGFQGVGDALLGFAFTSEGDKGLPLKVEGVPVMVREPLRGRKIEWGKLCSLPVPIECNQAIVKVL